jgi:hypothetical protein
MTLGLDGIAGFPGPRQELVQPIDGVSVDHALEDVDEIGVGSTPLSLVVSTNVQTIAHRSPPSDATS